jgi:hypothetical protein
MGPMGALAEAALDHGGMVTLVIPYFRNELIDQQLTVRFTPAALRFSAPP